MTTRDVGSQTERRETMLEIAIEERNSGKVAYVKLPANKYEVNDAMDRAKIIGGTSLRISSCDTVPELAGYEFKSEPTFYELNFLAKRLEEISVDKADITPTIAYRALLRKGFDTVNEAINHTYNLDTVPVFPCKDLSEYGDIVMENEFLEELKNLPDEVYDLLDAEKVGRVMAERENGVFIGGYYVTPDDYEPVLAESDQASKDDNSKLRRISGGDVEIMCAQHVLWLNQMNGERADFSGCLIEGLNLSYKNLNGALFNNAKLVNVNLHGAEMGTAVFIGATLRRCDLTETEAEQACFSDAKFLCTNMDRAIFIDSDFSGAQFHGSSMNGGSFVNCCFENADLKCMTMNSVNMDKCVYDTEQTSDFTMGGIS